MRFYIVLITLSLFVWIASAGVPGAGHLKSKVVTDDPTAPAAPDTETAPEVIPPEIANGGTPLPPPAGPRTPAEETADSVLNCMDSCAGVVACQNDCVSKGYNVNLNAPVPAATGSVPPPIGTTATANATATATTAPAASTTAHVASGAATPSLQMVGVAVAVGIASLFATL
ncbi:hypothetical protein BGX26_012673 [Mortierella sp. AD094]|nr:hypothetical protein BGX26_012673 [Mortierella sp. AD094]